MDLYAEIERQIADALADAGLGAVPSGVAVEVAAPRDAAHGDMASNVAMVLAKPLGMKPRDIAEKLAEKLAAAPDVAKAEVAGPGFLNITLKPHVWGRLVAGVLAEGAAYGRADLGRAEKVNIEYVSANPTGPMHVGHCRGAVFGDALANLLAFTGHEVAREYYINDAGAQVDTLARSAFLRYREALGEDIGPIPAGLYPGDYLVPVGKALADTYGDSLKDQPEAKWLPVVRDIALAKMMELVRDDLAALGITHEVFFSERSLHEPQPGNGSSKIAETIDEMRAKALVYEGRLEKPKGHDDGEWEDREQTLFRATAFGDDVDRALMKSDGSYTYFAADIAYHKTKIDRGFLNLIDVWGADHTGYVRRLKAAVAALSAGKAVLDVKICQLVKLLRGGQPVKMSKRAGEFVTLREVVDEVGRDPVRFMMLYRKNDAPLDFDLAKVIEQSKDNPVFYVQYAHARAASVFRNAKEVFPELTPDSPQVRKADLSRLTDEAEIDLMRRLAEFPRLVAGAARAHEPHRVAFYLYELASAFHQLWTRGHDSPHLRFIQPGDVGLTGARLALIAATKQVIFSGLTLLGVHAPQEMR